jgi:hypothetical protein
MTDDASLRQLLSLRRRSEQRALDVVMRSEEACRQGERAVAAATAQAARQARLGRIAEHGLVAAAIGRPLSGGALLRLGAELDALATTATDLRAAVAAAQTHLKDCTNTLGAARAAYRLRQRAAAKLDLLMKDQVHRTGRRAAAIAELSDDDRPARPHTAAASPAAM